MAARLPKGNLCHEKRRSATEMDNCSKEAHALIRVVWQIGYGSNKKTRHMMPSGHKAFVVNNPGDVDLLLMHNKTYAAEYVSKHPIHSHILIVARISHSVSSKKRVDIVAKAKQLGVKVTNAKARVTTES